MNYFTKRVCIFLLNKLVFILPTALYLKLLFRVKVGYRLDLNNPKTFNQKLQWLKLHDRQPAYTTMVDKVAVKDYVSSIIGEQYIIPTLGVWDSIDEVDFGCLPNQFVLKTSHGGGNCGVYICRNKDDMDLNAVKSLFKAAMKQNIYLYNKEWAYKNVTRRILAEQYLQEDDSGELHDYKVLCFGGQPKLVEFHTGRNIEGNHTQDFYTPDWVKTSISQGAGYGEVSSDVYPRPVCLDEMLRLSAKLSEGITHCRVDWFVVKDKLYFGEITFFDGGGFCAFDDYKDDELLGSWIDLKNVNSRS